MTSPGERPRSRTRAVSFPSARIRCGLRAGCPSKLRLLISLTESQGNARNPQQRFGTTEKRKGTNSRTKVGINSLTP